MLLVSDVLVIGKIADIDCVVLAR